MAIRRLLKNSDLNLQEQQLLELIYRRTLQQLNLVCGDPWCEAVARKIIDGHKRGAIDAVGISELAIRELGLPRAR